MKTVLALKQEDKPNIRIFRFNIPVMIPVTQSVMGTVLSRHFYSKKDLDVPDTWAKIGNSTTRLIGDIFEIGKEDEKKPDSVIRSITLTPWEIKIELNCAFYEQLEEKILRGIDQFLENLGHSGKMTICWGIRICRNGFHFDIPVPLPSDYSLDALGCLVTCLKDNS